MSDTVAAVVVTYNRKQLLTECLDALLAQTLSVQKIILIDNDSTDGTPEMLKERGYLDNPLIDYIRLPENTGGAGGFYEGVKRGHEAGYDWLWLMDDDAEAKSDSLELLSQYFRLESVAALANLKVGEDGTPQYWHRGWFKLCAFNNQAITPIDDKNIAADHVEIDHASFVGILIRKSAVDVIGLPKKEFFIHYDDVEYCHRLRGYGKIYLIPASIIMHKDNRNKRLIRSTILGRTSERVPKANLWISYYGFRNLVWLKTAYCKNHKTQILFMLLRQLIGVVVYDDNKIKRIKFYTMATQDGMKNRFDNDFPKLYL
ncbi:MAG: glycosyltransferase family 2 protein [Acidithiobacillus sp.]